MLGNKQKKNLAGSTGKFNKLLNAAQTKSKYNVSDV